MTTTQISATLGRKLLKNADKYFTNNSAIILDEMIQNARRANASALVFTADDNDLIISDNGRGLPFESAGVLLALGDSSNEEAIETAENAAGLGFFSLAAYDVVVSSQNWVMTVPKEAFTASATASLQKVEGYAAGLKVRICGFLRGKALATIATEILNATRFSKLSAQLVGFPDTDGPQSPADFMTTKLAGAIAYHKITSHGVTVAVARFDDHNQNRTAINFFGKVITSGFLSSVPETEKIASIDKEGKVRETAVRNLILIDVHDTSCLKLQLPQRQALIEGDGLSTVQNLVKQAYVTLLLQDGVTNGLPMDHKIRAANPIIPRPSLIVAALSGEQYISEPGLLRNGRTTVPLSEAFAMEDDALVEIGGSLFDSLVNSISRPEFAANRLFYACDLEAAYERGSFGYVNTIELVLNHDDDEQVVEISRAVLSSERAFYAALEIDEISTALIESGLDEHFNSVVDGLTLKFNVVAPNGQEAFFAHPISGIFFTPDGYVWEPTIIIAKGRENDISYMMMHGIDWYSSDIEASTYDDQQTDHQRQYDRLVASIVGNEEATFLAEIQDRIRSVLSAYDANKITGENGVLNLAISISNTDGSYADLTIEKVAA